MEEYGFTGEEGTSQARPYNLEITNPDRWFSEATFANRLDDGIYDISYGNVYRQAPDDVQIIGVRLITEDNRYTLSKQYRIMSDFRYVFYKPYMSKHTQRLLFNCPPSPFLLD